MTWLLLALACTKDTGTDDSAPPLVDDTVAPCEGNDPVLNAVTVTNGGVRDFDGTPYPTVLVEFDATDDDGNLNTVVMDIWVDQVIDGSVDTSGASDVNTVATLTEEDCSVTATGGASTVGVNIQVGGGLEYGTEYDWAGQITDANGEVSNVAFTTAWTPNSDGSDGGAEDGR